MKLEIQQCLEAGNTFEQLEAAYGIKARVNEELNVVCLNYSQIASPMHERICQECRSLILEIGTWRVVSRSFFKFFNAGEPNAAALDWNSARVQEKLDGSLISIYYWMDEWRIGSRSLPDASGMVGASSMTFRDLVLRAVAEMGYEWEEFTDALSPAYSYAFELTAPENRIIVNYPKRRLTLLAMWDKQTLEERPAEFMREWLPVVQEYPLVMDNFDVLKVMAEALDPFSNEGYVVVDKFNNRVKVKNPLYVMASNLVAGLSTERRHLELVLGGKCDDVLPLLPDHLRAELAGVQDTFAGMCAEIQANYRLIKGIEVQKDYAAEALKTPYAPVLFSLRKGQELDAIFQTMHLDTAVRIYDAYRIS